MILNIQDDILKLHALGLLDRLLADKTTKRHIMWATDAYGELGSRYERNEEILPELITGLNASVIKTRARKELEQQSSRTRQRGEVFTPFFICQKMCDHAHEALRGKDDWKKYVDSRVLEITSGEAPFLASRYNVETGEIIPVPERIGLLDRKLRMVSENAQTEEEWLRWAFRAFHATYAYEFQGDNLLISRVNLLLTFEEHLWERWRRKPMPQEYLRLVNVIAWNLWQMDGLKYAAPTGSLADSIYCQLSLFPQTLGPPDGAGDCRVFDWRKQRSFSYTELVGRERGTMKFDFVIGNPPYQEERRGDSTTALPIYHQFMESVYDLGTAVELITPARFLFDAGRTPKDWNKKMLSSNHLKVLYYEKNASLLFPNTEIKGGVAITYHDINKNFQPIGVFTVHEILNKIIQKVSAAPKPTMLSSIAFVATKFDIERLTQDFPQYVGHERRLSSNVLNFDCFTDAPMEDNDIKIYGIYAGKRAFRYIQKSYIDMKDSHIEAYKIVLPKADGNGNFGDVITNPEILPPQTGFTHTFLGIGNFETEFEAISTLKYIKTKFARTLLSVLKVTQDINADKWKLVPLQDFTPASDIDWTRSIPEIDQQLYAKYGLDEKEIAFIESHVKEMA